MEIIFERVAEERMSEDLCPVEAFFFIDADATIDEMTYIRININCFRNHHLSIHNLISEAFQVVLGELPGNLTDYHLVQDDSKGPNIAFVGVFLFIEDLGSHVGRSSHKRF